MRCNVHRALTFLFSFFLSLSLCPLQGKADLEVKVAHLEHDKQELERQVGEMRARMDQMEKREAERRALEERKHQEEIAFLKKANQQLKTQLEALLTPQVKKQ